MLFHDIALKPEQLLTRPLGKSTSTAQESLLGNMKLNEMSRLGDLGRSISQKLMGMGMWTLIS